MTPVSRLRRGIALIACMTAGCASSGTPAPADSVYAGTGFYDAWNWGPVYREPPIVVGPPAGPVPPIAPTARPLPAASTRPVPH